MVSPSVEDMVNDYLSKYETKEKACRAMLKDQIAKCATSGIVNFEKMLPGVGAIVGGRLDLVETKIIAESYII